LFAGGKPDETIRQVIGLTFDMVRVTAASTFLVKKRHFFAF